MKQFRIIVLSLFLPFISFSQGVEIVPFAGYMLGGHSNYSEGKISIDDGTAYGISILKPIRTGIDLELNYTRMESRMSFEPYSGYQIKSDESDLATNYFQIGALQKFKPDSNKIIPFVSISLGATWFDSSKFGDEVRFSAALGAGLKIMLTDKIGIIARGRLLMPMEFAGIGFTVGTGGSGLTAGSYITPLQGDFTGGLIICIGQ